MKTELTESGDKRPSLTNQESWEPYAGKREELRSEIARSLREDYASVMKYIATFSGSCLVFTGTFLKQGKISCEVIAACWLWFSSIILIILALGISVILQHLFLEALSDRHRKWNDLPNPHNWVQAMLVGGALICFVLAFYQFITSIIQK